MTTQGRRMARNNDVTFETAVTRKGAGSFQAVAVDMTIDASAGTSTAGDTDFIAPGMFNALGAALTKTNNYIAALIAHYSITSTNASTMPKGAVLAGIGDGSTTADGAVVAYTDGDSATTTANAAFKIMNNSAIAATKFTYGLDCQSGAHNGFNAVDIANADIRLHDGPWIKSGTASTRAAIEAEIPTAPIGSRYFSTAGKSYLKVADAGAATDWEKVTTSAAD